MSRANRFLQANAHWLLAVCCVSLGLVALGATPPTLVQPVYADGESCGPYSPCPEGYHCCGGSCCPDDYNCCDDICKVCPCDCQCGP